MKVEVHVSVAEGKEDSEGLLDVGAESKVFEVLVADDVEDVTEAALTDFHVIVPIKVLENYEITVATPE